MGDGLPDLVDDGIWTDEDADRMDRLYDAKPKRGFAFTDPYFGLNLGIEYVLISSDERPEEEHSPAFALSRGINLFIRVSQKVFICEDLIPNPKFFRYLAIHEAFEEKSSHTSATIIEMKCAEEELTDEELIEYCRFRQSTGDPLFAGPSMPYNKSLEAHLPEKVKAIMFPDG